MAVMLPGLGHVVIGEPLRGLGFCALTEGSFLMAMLSLYPMNENSNPTLRKILAISGATLCLSSYIWSIADVTRVAKIKNMAFREKKTSNTSLSFLAKL